MTKRISRRKFLQMGGLAGTAVALSGCTISLQKPEFLTPYVVPPEEALPGQNIWYASACAPVPRRLRHPRARQQRAGAQDRRAIRCTR